MILRLLLVFISLFLSIQVYATHIVGGEFELKHLSNNSYGLSLHLYFDEINGTQEARRPEPSIKASIFEKGTNRFVKEITLPFREVNLLNYNNVGCTTSGLRTSKLLYYLEITLSPANYNHPEGYYVAVERCCRNKTTNNISSGFEAGTTFYMEIPPVVKNGVPFINSTPKLTPPPSDYACQGELFSYDFGSTDADGDKLVYDMVSPLNGYSTPNNSKPPASSGPYPEISWLPGYDKDNQIHGNPSVSIDRATGWLTVRPQYAGLYVFAVRCQEFRNGVKIGEVRREFQLVVKVCRFNNVPVVSVKQVGSQSTYTDGQVLRIRSSDPRCIKILYTDPEVSEPLTLEVNPVNFTNDNVFSVIGTTSGVVNNPNGAKTLEATICFEQCLDTNGQTYLLDLVVSDDGDDGCGQPLKTTRRISLVIEPAQGNAPDISLSSPTKVFEVVKGDRISFDVTGTDADDEEVSISAAGRGFKLNAHKISFQAKKNKGKATSPFSWHIDKEALKQSSFFVDFLVTSTTSCGDRLTKTETIEIRPLWVNDFAGNTISADQTICAGGVPATLTGSLPTGGSGTYEYTWEMSTTNDQNGFELAPGPRNKEQHYSPPALTTGPVWFRRKASSGMNDEHISTAVQITVRNVIGNNTISRAQSICANTAPALLTGTEPSGGSGTYSYQWEYSTTGPTSDFKPITETGKGKEKDYQPGVLKQTTWYRRMVMSSPCPPVPSNAVEITVTPDISQNTITGNQVVCEGNIPAKLTGPVLTSSTDRFTYEWEQSTTSATTGFSPAPGLNTAPEYAPNLLTQPNNWFRRIVRTAAASCQSTSNVVLVTIEALPAPPQTTDVSVCPGAPAILQASSPATGIIFKWYDQASGGTLLHEGSTYKSAPLRATTDFYVQAFTRNGCTGTSRKKVTAIVRTFTADAGPDVIIMEGQSAKLQATGGISYSWSPATDMSNPTSQNPAVKPLKTTTYTVTVTSDFGCITNDEVTVTVLPRIVPTNAITVNGDNINETWYIKNIELYPNCKVQVFTRWGNKIYESTGYNEPWNGTHNGLPLPMAAYYYIIDLGMNEKPVAGSITLIK